jgi:hypothetical protein
MSAQGLNPFERTTIKFSPNGDTRVQWDLTRLLTDPGPYYFTLQGARSSVDTGDFINIGIPALNAWYLVDDENRLFGKSEDWFYRIKLQTGLRTYYSPIISADSGVDYRTWRLAREIYRKEKLRLGKYAGLESTLLLKRKRSGQKCTRCADPLTDEPIDNNCQVCLGTGTVNGYYKAVPILIEMPVSNEVEKVDIEYSGTKGQAMVQNCRILGDPAVVSQDVIWDKGSGRRFVVHETTELVTMRGYNIVSAVNLRMAPFTDVIYTIPEDGV